jgi:hypothetical protein
MKFRGFGKFLNQFSQSGGVYWKKLEPFTEKTPTLIFSPSPQAAGRNSPKIAAGGRKGRSFRGKEFLPARLYSLRGRATKKF